MKENKTVLKKLTGEEKEIVLHNLRQIGETIESLKWAVIYDDLNLGNMLHPEEVYVGNLKWEIEAVWDMLVGKEKILYLPE